MRWVILYIFSSLSFVCSFSQTKDTLFVTNRFSASVAVPSKIAITNIGSDTYFEKQANFNLLTLALKDKNLNKQVYTNLVIGYLNPENKIIYKHFIVAFIPDDTKNRSYFFDYTQEFKIQEAKNKSKKRTKKDIKRALILERLRILKSKKSRINDLGVKSEIDVLVKDMYVDDENLYLKFKLINNSGIDFNLNFISFQYINRVFKGLFKKREEIPVDVTPIILDNEDKLKANKEMILCFAVELYGLKNKDYLNIVFREKKGARNLSFKLLGKQIKNAKWFNIK